MNHDPIKRLEHDHVHLSDQVNHLRDWIQQVLREEVAPEHLEPKFTATLIQLRDELFHHFAREEEGLFPFIIAQLPSLAEAIGSLESAHDRVCGSVSRMTYLAQQGPVVFSEQFEQMVALFARFDANYGKHARSESELLRTLAEQLNHQQREELYQILQEL
jgi:iron-sulfur cluster repair protein YtfE (RIC family)